jgi:DNA polymerase
VSFPGGGVEPLAAIATRVRACTGCPLALGRIRAVPGSGALLSRVVLIGEAPGATEDRCGEPFVGAAGRLLTELLGGAGLDRSRVFITNAVKCRPPHNRDPRPEEVAACAPFLEAQLEVINPQVVVTLGRHAMARLLPQAGMISAEHGRRFRVAGRTVIPLYHPAAAIYDRGLRAVLEQDLRSLAGMLEAGACG